MHRILGIVAEYNPLHKGHYFQLQTAIRETESDFTIIAMSGNFVQRGEPAVLPKWTRAQMALAAGADLVVEIPTYFVLHSAEGFARAGIGLLSNCGITDISFGSESGHMAELKSLAQWLSLDSTQGSIVNMLKLGVSYAAAIQLAAEAADPDIAGLAPMLKGANNILGIEYLKALIQNPDIAVHTVKRVGPEHGTLATGVFASATALRKLLHAGDISAVDGFIPQCTKEIFKNALMKYRPVSSEDFAQAIYYSLTTSAESLASLPACSEGLENRILNFIDNHRDLAGLLKAVKTKRYPFTRIQRFLMQALLQFHTVDPGTGYCPYIRVLGCTSRGKQLLPQITKLKNAPLIFSARDIDGLKPGAKSLLDLDFRAAGIYNLGLDPSSIGPKDVSTMPVTL